MNIRFILYNIIHFLPLSNFIFSPGKTQKVHTSAPGLWYSNLYLKIF